MNREFASRIIAVINDLMNEAVGGGVVQEWGEVNNVLIELEKIAKGGDHVLAIPEQFHTVRKEVVQFALAMEEKLKKNDWKGGSEDLSDLDLFDKLFEEFEELSEFVEENNPKEVINEAIAVANFAMMLYDNISKRESKKEAIF